jgi:hypothetical protein
MRSSRSSYGLPVMGGRLWDDSGSAVPGFVPCNPRCSLVVRPVIFFGDLFVFCHLLVEVGVSLT